MNLDPAANPGARAPAALQGSDDAADLPALAQPTDLPSVAGGRGKRPEIRKPGQLGMTAGGGASMAGKPPPKMAPQPFGKMEKIGAEDSPPSRTAAMQARPQPPPAPSVRRAQRASVEAARAAAGTHLRDARAERAAAATPRRDQPPPSSARADPERRRRSARRLPARRPSGRSDRRQSAASAVPVCTAASAAPRSSVASAARQRSRSRRPSARSLRWPRGFAPPGPSQPPIFGAYQSAPPDAPLDVNAMGASFDQTASLHAPGMPQNIGYQAPVLVDVTPRGLVVETAGGYTDTIIPRNSKIPCERTRRFATGRDMQTTVRVRVGQGEGNMFPQNTFLGEVELSGLRPAPRGEVVVAVTFEVDADGTLRIRARDVQTGQEARATLQLIGVADESSVVMMINRFAQQPVVGTETPRGPTH